MSKITAILVGIMLFSMIILGFSGFLDGLNDNYNVPINENWADVYDFTGNITDEAKAVQDTLNDPNANWVTSGLRLGYSTLKIILGSPRYISQLLQNMAQALYLPAWFVANVTIIMILIIMIIMVGALVRWTL